MIDNLGNVDEERQRTVNAVSPFAPLLDQTDLTEEAIDDAIEELRPLRMHIHAIDYGDAPGFRKRKLETAK